MALPGMHMLSLAISWLRPPTSSRQTTLQAMACSADPDPHSLVDMFLQEKLALNRTFKDYQLLKARQGATKRELDIINRRVAKVLHPDKHELQDWTIQHYPNIAQDCLDQAIKILKDFWDNWLATKTRLVDVDEGTYKQAPSDVASATCANMACCLNFVIGCSC